MYFFYIDESGTKDTQTGTTTRQDGSEVHREHIYALTAVSLYEFRWRAFEREITNLKLELSDQHHRKTGTRFELAACEVKSVWMRLPSLRQRESPFLHALSDADRTRIADTYYAQLQSCRMKVFSVVVDKRCLRAHMDHDTLFKKAYELLLERIEHYMAEFHPKHQALIVMDDSGRQENRSLAMKHAYIQREGNGNVHFRHIVEYPMFTDSALSNGVQLADLCGYNVYRAFRNRDFSYPFFERLLDCFYRSERTGKDKLDGLKVWPNESELVEFARQSWSARQTAQPTLFGWAAKAKEGK